MVVPAVGIGSMSGAFLWAVQPVSPRAVPQAKNQDDFER